MRIKVSSPNPLGQTQESLSIIRKQIKAQHPDSEIEIRGYEHRPDVTRCTAQVRIPSAKSNWCSGSVISVGNPVEREANAELVAITMCCREIGIEVDFGERTEADIITAQPMEKFDRAAVIACKDLSQVIFRMKQYGMDTESLLRYGRDLKKKGQRLTKHAAATYLFPDSANHVYAHPVKQEVKVKKKAERKKEKPEEIVAPVVKSQQRSMDQAAKVVSELTGKGISMEDVQKIFGTEFQSLLNFALFATQNQINTVSPTP